MRKVFFKRIEIQNFLSVGNEPVVLEYKNGLNIITGANLDKEDSGNGIGKSTIVEAIYFVLFGNTIRELKVDQIAHYNSNGKCNVTLNFDIIDGDKKKEYVLTRNLKPSKIHLEEGGVDVTKSTIAKTNQFIQQLIRANAEVFQNSVIMTANNAVPFMSQRKLDKRKFLEGILGLGVFGDMLSLSKQQYNDCKSEYNIEYTKQQEQQKSLNKYTDQFNQYKQRKADKIKIYNNRIEQYTNKISELEAKLTEVEECLSKHKTLPSTDQIDTALDKLTNDITDITHELTVWNYKVGETTKKIEEIESIPDVCVSCERPLTKKLIQEHAKHTKELKSSIETLNSDIESKTKEVDELKNKKAQIKDKRDKIIKAHQNIHHMKSNKDTIKSTIKSNQRLIQEAKADITGLDKDDDDYISYIDELEEKIGEARSIVKNINQRLEILQTVKFIVSEEGVRSFVVKKILQVMNSRINYYLCKLDANCTLQFNEYFTETLIDEKGRECSYHNFSSGEKKRIDLAILFTFQDIRRLQASVDLNISMYDELLDSSLDTKGRTCVVDILNERVEKYNECIYIVTHRPDALDVISGDIIFVEKENGVTRISNTYS